MLKLRKNRSLRPVLSYSYTLHIIYISASSFILMISLLFTSSMVYSMK